MSDLLPSPGYATIRQEFEAKIKEGFKDIELDDDAFIFVDSRRQRFLSGCIAYGESMGWLKGKLVEIDHQYSQYRAYLTDAGRKYFGWIE